MDAWRAGCKSSRSFFLAERLRGDVPAEKESMNLGLILCVSSRSKFAFGG